MKYQISMFVVIPDSFSSDTDFKISNTVGLEIKMNGSVESKQDNTPRRYVLLSGEVETDSLEQYFKNTYTELSEFLNDFWIDGDWVPIFKPTSFSVDKNEVKININHEPMME